MFFNDHRIKDYSFTHTVPKDIPEYNSNSNNALDVFLGLTSSKQINFSAWEEKVLNPIYHDLKEYGDAICFAQFIPSEKVWTYSSTSKDKQMITFHYETPYLITPQKNPSQLSHSNLQVFSKFEKIKLDVASNDEVNKLFKLYTLTLPYFAANLARYGILYCMKYLHERKTFGVLLIDHPVILDSIVTAVNEIEASLLYLHDLTSKIEQNKKVYIEEIYKGGSLVCQSAITAIDQVSVLMGAKGYSQEASFTEWITTLHEINAFMNQMAKVYGSSRTDFSKGEES
ncbi:acyl-CoA dehydrogenase family protein [Cytobacillus oceanisediminis]|uniref:acyl-CoA dehydrogenase family protein n=1 Tax=Cytobacillus oceanisediminis TaxID=665099 RepID=UPI001C244702|nr:acyl-CoA dehydrogenase family protein [Cytobacillus oceanisediminis]MBU8772056.1 acyl-CoA/acyl-ACP dehydrogenase [Cytobacillus oceanisediminis]